MKKNKEYAKDVFKYIKENTDLKNNAEKDAETLADTLSNKSQEQTNLMCIMC